MTQRFFLNLPDDLVSEAEAAAAEAHLSVDELLARLVADSFSRRRGMLAIEERAARGKVEAALAVLDRVPVVEPDAGDAVM